jgi:hypothetical protein
MAHPVEVVVRDGTIRRDSGQKNFAAASKTGSGVRHAFSHTDNQIREGNMGIDLHERPPMGSADNDVVRGMRVMGNESALETAEDFFPYLFPELFSRGNGVSSDGADASDPAIGDTCAVQPIEDFGQGEVDRGRPLKVIEKESHFHPRTGQLLKSLRPNGMIQGAADLRLWIRYPFYGRPVRRRDDIPFFGDAEELLLRFVIDIIIHGAISSRRDRPAFIPMYNVYLSDSKKSNSKAGCGRPPRKSLFPTWKPIFARRDGSSSPILDPFGGAERRSGSTLSELEGLTSEVF